MKTELVPLRFPLALLAIVGLVLAGCNMSFTISDGYMFTNTGQTAESTEAGTISQAITAIEVNNQFGNVKIELANGEPGWKWDSKVWADSQQWADLLIDELAMDVQTNGQTQTWQIVLPEATSDLNGVQSNLTLLVPSGVTVKLANSHGHVSVAKVDANVELTNRHGNVELTEVKGKLNVENSHGDLNASEIGSATIGVSHGNTEVLAAAGNVKISSSHGKVQAAEIAGELTIDASHTDIKVDRVDSHGDLNTTHGRIVATNLGGDVKASNSHGSTRISTFGENVTIRAIHGQVELMMASSSFHSIDIETTHQPIKVELPADADPAIEMNASYGETKSEFGTSGGSPQKVKLRTSHADIRVTRHEMVAEVSTEAAQ